MVRKSAIFFRAILVLLLLLAGVNSGWAAVVAIFPFEDLSRGRNFVNLEVTENVAASLRQRGVEVTGFDAVRPFMVRHVVRILGDLDSNTIRMVPAELGAEYLLVGSISQLDSGETPAVGMSLRLVRAADVSTVWTETRGASVSDVQRILGLAAPSTIDELLLFLVDRLFESWPADLDGLAAQADPGNIPLLSALNVEAVTFGPTIVQPGEQVRCEVQFRSAEIIAEQPQVFIRIGNRVQTASLLRSAPLQQAAAAENDESRREAGKEVPGREAAGAENFREARDSDGVREAQGDEPTREAADPGPFREAADPAPFREATDPAPFREAADPGPFREAADPAPYREAADPAPYREAADPAPYREASTKSWRKPEVVKEPEVLFASRFGTPADPVYYQAAWVGSEVSHLKDLSEAELRHGNIAALASDSSSVFGGVWQSSWDADRYPVSMILSWPSGRQEEIFLGSYVVDAEPPSLSIELRGKEVDGERIFGREVLVVPKLKVAEPLRKWRLVVESEEGTAALEVDGKGRLPEYFTWRGQVGGGVKAVPGLYDIVLKAWDLAGNEAEARQKVRYEPRPPQIAVQAALAENGLALALENSLPVPLAYWQLQLWNDQGELLHRASGEALPVDLAIALDGEQLQQTDTLEAVVVARDVLGNQMKQRVANLLQLAGTSGQQEGEAVEETDSGPSWDTEF